MTSGDENERRSALGSIEKIDSQDIDFLVQTTWSFDPGYLQTVVEQVGRVRNEKSAAAISAILFASTEKSQEAIRIRCIDALAENLTEPATQTLLNVSKNEKFYRTQCHAVRKLGTRQPEQRILWLLHVIVEEGPRTPTSDEAKGDPHRLVLHAFEALTSESLRNPESAEVILSKIADPGCEEYYRQEGIKHLVKMGFPSLVDSALNKIEKLLENERVVFPLSRLLAHLNQTAKQRARIHEVVKVLLGKTRSTEAMNPDLVSVMKATLDENLIDVVSNVTCTWELNGPAGSPIVEMLNACPKTRTSTVTALLRYAECPQWSVNKARVLPNLKQAYLQNPKAVVRSLFESDQPAYGECRDYLRQQYNTPADREGFVGNIRDGIEAFVQGPLEDADQFKRHLSQYFGELRNILRPLFKESISEDGWRLATDKWLYRLIKLASKCQEEQRSGLEEELVKSIDYLLRNPTTGAQFVENCTDDWLMQRKRAAAKYVLNEACAAEEHRKNTIQILVRRAAHFFHKGEAVTDDEKLYQKWVSQNVVGQWKAEAKLVLDECLVESDEFNAWAYDTLRQRDLLDCSMIVRGLTSKISDGYTMRLLEDLVPRYSADAEDTLVQKMRHGRTAKIRGCATTAAGAIFDYEVNPNCPNTVLAAVQERFTEQNPEVRETAYASLGKICSPESIDALQEAKAKDTKLESVIKQSLDNLFAKFSEARPSEENVDTTIAWIKVIGKIADKRGFEKLKPYVDPDSCHRDEAVRLTAVEAIGLVGSSEHIDFLEELKERESHSSDLTREIERAIGFISNIGDFELLDILRKLTDDRPPFSDKSAPIKSQCFRAYKAWLGGDYSLYATHLDNVCDSVSRRILDVFQDELFKGNTQEYVGLRRTNKARRRYEFLRSKPGFSLIGSCFCTVHALRVEAPIPHGEDSKTEQLKTDLTPEEGELAKKNFIDAITRSVEMIKKKVLR